MIIWGYKKWRILIGRTNAVRTIFKQMLQLKLENTMEVHISVIWLLVFSVSCIGFGLFVCVRLYVLVCLELIFHDLMSIKFVNYTYFKS